MHACRFYICVHTSVDYVCISVDFFFVCVCRYMIYFKALAYAAVRAGESETCSPGLQTDRISSSAGKPQLWGLPGC